MTSTFKQTTLLEISRNNRPVEQYAMNELRAILYMRGFSYSDDATKAELIELVQNK